MGWWENVKSAAGSAVNVVKDVATGHPIEAVKDAGKTVSSVVKADIDIVKGVGHEAIDLGKVGVNAVKNQIVTAKDGIGLGIDVLTGNTIAAKNKLIDLAQDGKNTVKNWQRGINNKLLLPFTVVPGVNAVYGGLDAGLNIAGAVADKVPIPSKGGSQTPVNVDNSEPSNLMNLKGVARGQFEQNAAYSTVNAAMADMDPGMEQQAPSARSGMSNAARNIKPD